MSAQPLITPQQAAVRALASWLRGRLPLFDPKAPRGLQGVEIADEWPSDAEPLPERKIAILLAGDPIEFVTQPEVLTTQEIHAGVSPLPPRTPILSDAGAFLALNAAPDSYEAHRVSLQAHVAIDAADVVSTPPAVDVRSAVERATELLMLLPEHYESSAHETADDDGTIARFGDVTPGRLRDAAAAILDDLVRHYLARVYLYRIGEIEQPVQLDAWATTEPSRDDLCALVESATNASMNESAGFESDAGAVRRGVLVPLGDGWEGSYADFEFAPFRRIDSPDAAQAAEFRATVRGTVKLFRTLKKQRPRLRVLELEAAPLPRPAPRRTAGRRSLRR